MKAPTYCLDAGIFIAVATPDKHTEEIRSSLQSLLRKVERKEARVIVSALIFAELLDGSFDILERLLDGTKGFSVDVDPPIAKLARAIRRKVGVKLSAPDCTYLATAKIYEVDALLKLEGLSMKDGVTSPNNKLNMLSAAAEIEQHFGVKIKTPCDITDQHVLEMRFEP